ncbi:MAG: nonstructural protein [Arizlama microvirus]|nr:MAG: nonstructural protein [Arizlama microvirus]
MKIYAIRDRLIDYFMQPFVGPDDKSVLASVARLVNTGEVTSDIAQAPHQFEVWCLGNVSDDGHLVPEKQYLADCHSLIRGGIRRNPPSEPGMGTPEHPEISRHRAPEDTGGANGHPPGSPLQGGTAGSQEQAAQAYRAAARGT